MRNHVMVEINVGALKQMTHAQLDALQNNILADNCWETADKLFISGGDYIGAQPFRNGDRMIFIGIEKDGYTHS